LITGIPEIPSARQVEYNLVRPQESRILDLNAVSDRCPEDHADG
jgi:hypothetical protein